MEMRRNCEVSIGKNSKWILGFYVNTYCKVLSVMMRDLNNYSEICFFWNRISLDLNYSRLAGTSLTVITETF